MLRGVLPGQSDLAFLWVYRQHRGRPVGVAPGQSPISAADLQHILSVEINQAMHYPGLYAFWIKYRGHFTLPCALPGPRETGRLTKALYADILKGSVGALYFILVGRSIKNRLGSEVDKFIVWL